jgi:hypothetical protein
MLNGLIASLRRFLRPAPLHVCYVLSLDEDTLYADMLNISAMCVWRIYPSARITILTDDQSLPRVQKELKPITSTGAKIWTVGRFEGNPRQRSRFVKTQMRNALQGDFLYLDADTVPVSRFDALIRSRSRLSAAIDRNRVSPDGSFPSRVVPDFRRLGWPYPTEVYLNTGVLFWKDCREAHELGQQWHRNWLHYTAAVDNPSDQPSFNHSLNMLGIKPKIISDVHNARLGVSPRFTDGAVIYHLLSGDERANGTFIDLLLYRYRTSGKVDFALIEKTAGRGNPWIGERPPM